MNNKTLISLAFVIVIALAVRFWRINTPLADWHSWRQADTAAVTRIYVEEGIDFLHPRYDDLSSIPSGKENPNGYRMVEFPIINGLTAFLYQHIPTARLLEVHVFSRIVSIAFSLGSLIVLYRLVKLFSGDLEAILAALVFALLPYNIYYSRVVLPEVSWTFFSLLTLYMISNWLLDEKHAIASWKFWIGALSAAMTLLLKPYAVFLSFPLLYLTWKQCRWNLLKSRSTYIFVLISLTPFVLWRLWIEQFPEGIPAYQWLLNGNGIRLKGAFFQWLFADRLGRLILGYWGLVPFGLGLLVRPAQKEGWFYRWWMFGILAYVTVFATGNVQHDYYQIFSIPIISIFVAKGFVFLLHPPKELSLLTAYCLLFITSAFALAFGWYNVRDYFNINHPEIVEAGKAADRLLSDDAKVIAPYGGDTAFLYQTDRSGWPIGGSIEEKIKRGATHYISVNFDDETRKWMTWCQIALESDRFVIINLQQCSSVTK